MSGAKVDNASADKLTSASGAPEGLRVWSASDIHERSQRCKRCERVYVADEVDIAVAAKDAALAEEKEISAELRRQIAATELRREDFEKEIAQLRERLSREENEHAALQARCFEGHPSLSDGVFSEVKELRERLARFERPTDAQCDAISEALSNSEWTGFTRDDIRALSKAIAMPLPEVTP